MLESSLPGGDCYLLKVTYPEEFPDEAPFVTIEGPELAVLPATVLGLELSLVDLLPEAR